MEYAIKDLDGNIISKKEGRGALAVKLSSVVSLLIPTTVKPGVYVALVKVTTEDGKSAVGSKTFEIRTPGGTIWVIVGYGLLILVLVFIITFVFYRFFLSGRAHKTVRRVHKKAHRKKRRR